MNSQENASNGISVRRSSRSNVIDRVLVVEDSRSQALSLKTVLEATGLGVIIVGDGPEAIEVAQTEVIDLIVLDIELPTLSGYDTCRRLKANPITADIPIIILSCRDRPLDTLSGLELGVVDYIPKDAFAQVTLLGTINKLNQMYLKR